MTFVYWFGGYVLIVVLFIIAWSIFHKGSRRRRDEQAAYDWQFRQMTEPLEDEEES